MESMKSDINNSNFNIFHPVSNNYDYNDKYSNITNHQINHTLKKRKYMNDNIRKKIKSDFLKALRKCINKKLEALISNYSYLKLCNFPASIVSNVTKKLNKKLFNMTFREILLENSFEEFGHIIKTNLESKICENKKKVLEILENKNDANFDIIQNLKIKDIFNEYLISDEFKKNIEHLEEGENAEYIIKYIKIANDMADFFLL